MPREKKKNEEPGAPMWMVTYGDLMSLLLTFFVLLLSFSTISQEEFNQAAESLRNAFNLMPRNMGVLPMNNTSSAKRSARDTERVARMLRERLQELGQEKEIEVEYDEQGGLKINLPSQVLFESAAAELKPDAFPVLSSVTEILAGLPGAFFEVRGHTDSRPLGNSLKFRDNYDLSFARADTVARFLAGGGRIPMDQFEIIACGAGQPVANNETLDGRQKNRRVEIFVRANLSDSELEGLHEKMREEILPAVTPEAAANVTNEGAQP